MKHSSYWILGTGIVVFLIGSYMYVSWILGLCIISCTQDFFKLGNFTFEKFAAGTYSLYVCPPSKSPYYEPLCYSDLAKFDYASIYLWLPLIVWLAGLVLIVHSFHDIWRQRHTLMARQRGYRIPK